MHIPWACAHVPTDSHSPIFRKARWLTSVRCISAWATSHRQKPPCLTIQTGRSPCGGVAEANISMLRRVWLCRLYILQNTARSRSLLHSAREWALFLSTVPRLCCRKASTARRLPSMPLRAARGQAAATATRRHLEARIIGRRQYCRCRQPMPLPQRAACGNMRLSFQPTPEWITATTRLPHRCALTMW